MIQIEGMIDEQAVSVLIDPRENLSYISAQMVEKFKLKLENFQQAWIVKLATKSKRKLTHKLPKIVVNLNGYET